MLRDLLSILGTLRVQDMVDVLLLSWVACVLYRWFWGTRAFRALMGLLLLGVAYTVARAWGLFLTTWVFQVFWQVWLVMLIILFQAEIRRALERVDLLRVLGRHRHDSTGVWIDTSAEAVFALAQAGLGALVVIERVDAVDEWITGGVVMETEPIREVLTSVFQKASPLHDGAVILRGGRLARAAAVLPMTTQEGLPSEWGTRHRAALGLSERCDAWVVAVSEERGTVTLARGGRLVHIEGAAALSELLRQALAPARRPGTSWGRRSVQGLLERWPIKVGIVVSVSVAWLLLAGRQEIETTLVVPVKFRRLPPSMVLMDQGNLTAAVTVRGRRKEVGLLDDRNTFVRVDLSEAGLNNPVFNLGHSQVVLPSDSVRVTRIDPSQLTLDLREQHRQADGADTDPAVHGTPAVPSSPSARSDAP